MRDLEKRVLRRAIATHPDLLTTDELTRWIGVPREDVCSAVESLRRVALLVPGERVGPTRAALSYRQIIRAR